MATGAAAILGAATHAGAARAGAARIPRRSRSGSGKAATTATMAKRINFKYNKILLLPCYTYK